jgi:hypothetical protein
MKLSNKMQTIIGYVLFGLGLVLIVSIVIFAATNGI